MTERKPGKPFYKELSKEELENHYSIINSVINNYKIPKLKHCIFCSEFERQRDDTWCKNCTWYAITGHGCSKGGNKIASMLNQPQAGCLVFSKSLNLHYNQVVPIRLKQLYAWKTIITKELKRRK